MLESAIAHSRTGSLKNAHSQSSQSREGFARPPYANAIGLSKEWFVAGVVHGFQSACIIWSNGTRAFLQGETCLCWPHATRWDVALPVIVGFAGAPAWTCGSAEAAMWARKMWRASLDLQAVP